MGEVRGSHRPKTTREKKRKKKKGKREKKREGLLGWSGRSLCLQSGVSCCGVSVSLNL